MTKGTNKSPGASSHSHHCLVLSSFYRAALSPTHTDSRSRRYLSRTLVHFGSLSSIIGYYLTDLAYGQHSLFHLSLHITLASTATSLHLRTITASHPFDCQWPTSEDIKRDCVRDWTGTASLLVKAVKRDLGERWFSLHRAVAATCPPSWQTKQSEAHMSPTESVR